MININNKQLIRCGYTHTFVKDISPHKESRGINLIPWQRIGSFRVKKKSEWTYIHPHHKDCCNPIASLLLGVIFHALLRRVSVILNTVAIN